MRREFLPFAQPLIGDDEFRAAVRVLESGWLTSGPRVKEFEQAFRDYLGCRAAVALSSGTSALHLPLMVSGIGNGHEVITTPFTFASTANVIALVGATPVFVDIEEDSFNIDVAKIEERVTEKTKAIIPMHFGGRSCDMDAVRAVARTHGLLVVEDATHALGSAYRGTRVGASSDFAAFSFYPTKNITAAEGGMVVTRDIDSERDFHTLRWYGLSAHASERSARTNYEAPVVLRPGFKCSMSDLQAAIGLVQLRKLDEFNAVRRSHAAAYREALDSVEELRLPLSDDDNFQSSWHLFVVRLSRKLIRCDRVEFCEALADRGIGTSYHYPSLHLHPYYRDRHGLAPDDFPVAKAASQDVVSLPLYPRMNELDVLKVANAVKDAIVQVR